MGRRLFLPELKDLPKKYLFKPWEAPEDVEKGYNSFRRFYKANYLKSMPADKNADILIVCCGPGYFQSAAERPTVASETVPSPALPRR